MKNNKNNKNKNYPGFSLLEMLIAIFIFVLMITASVSVFTGVFSARQEGRKIEKNMENARTALDLMAKNMRMSTNLVRLSDQEIYMYNNSQGQCIGYKFEDGELRIGQATPAGMDCDPAHVLYGSYNPITSGDVSGSFSVTPTSDVSPKKIGKATITMTIDGSTSMQTTVSFRDYNNIIQ